MDQCVLGSSVTTSVLGVIINGTGVLLVHIIQYALYEHSV